MVSFVSSPSSGGTCGVTSPATSRALSSVTETAGDERLHALHERFDLLSMVDGDRDERQVLREREQPLRVELLLDAKPSVCAEQHSGRHPLGLELVEEHVGEQMTWTRSLSPK